MADTPGRIYVSVPSVHLIHDLKATRAVLRKVANAAARDARAAARRKSGGGRAYYYNGKLIQASAPGEAPVRRSGQLAGNIRVRSGRGKSLSMIISDKAFYAKMIETGSVGGGGRKGNRNKRKRGEVTQASSGRVQAARPFLSTAVEKNTQNLGETLVESINQHLAMKAGKLNGARR